MRVAIFQSAIRSRTCYPSPLPLNRIEVTWHKPSQSVGGQNVGLYGDIPLHPRGCTTCTRISDRKATEGWSGIDSWIQHKMTLPIVRERMFTVPLASTLKQQVQLRPSSHLPASYQKLLDQLDSIWTLQKSAIRSRISTRPR